MQPTRAYLFTLAMGVLASRTVRSGQGRPSHICIIAFMISSGVVFAEMFPPPLAQTLCLPPLLVFPTRANPNNVDINRNWDDKFGGGTNLDQTNAGPRTFVGMVFRLLRFF